MTGFFFRLTFLLTMVFGAVIGAICAQNTLDLPRNFLAPSNGCVMPCWEGIRPGVTTEADALAILKAHPWIGNVDRFETSWGLIEISWLWNGRQPAYINPRSPATLWVLNDVVQEVRFRTMLEFGDVWLMFDQPERGGFAYSNGPGILTPSAHIADYPDDGLAFFSLLDCQHFWRQTSDVVIGSAETLNLDTLDEYDLSDFRHVSCQP